MKTIGTARLGELMGLSPFSVHSALSRRPDRFPPPIRVPGSNKLIWDEDEVIAWLKQYQQRPAIKRRGRPTKAEQRTQAREGAASYIRRNYTVTPNDLQAGRLNDEY